MVLRREVVQTMDSYPYVTGMGFRNRCHMIYDEFRQDGAESITDANQTVFVKTDYVFSFMENVLPHISHPIVLVTHNSAIGIDSQYSKFLQNPKISRWYAQNANFPHPKLFSIPLGMANYRWEHGETSEIQKVNSKKLEKTHLAYMNFDSSTNSFERTPVLENFREKKFVKKAERKPFSEYLHDLAESKYSISPQGRGVDCLRIWESLLVHTVPIVKKCHNISFYDNMPILVIEEWDTVTEDFLNEQYPLIIENGWNNDCLFMDYWIEEIGLIDLKHKTPKIGE